MAYTSSSSKKIPLLRTGICTVKHSKRHAEDHPTERPSKILAVEIQHEDDVEVLAHLRERENL